MKNVELDGPTYFAPLIKAVVEETQNAYRLNPDSYTVLLILTDGCIHDMPQTKDWIVEGSYLPLSIIIIGIGDADFSNMEVLDSDNQVTSGHQLLQGSKKTAQRDIVQFVPFNEFKNNPEDLAAKVIEELPDQVVSFYRFAGRKPAILSQKKSSLERNTHYPDAPDSY